MSRLEIIHLRSAEEPVNSLGQRIRESIGAQAQGAEIVTLYRRRGLETDVAIHIHDSEPSKTSQQSLLASRLAIALSAFGLVKHTVWEEMPAEGVAERSGGE